MPKGVSKFRQAVVGKLASEKDKLTPLSQEMVWKVWTLREVLLFRVPPWPQPAGV